MLPAAESHKSRPRERTARLLGPGRSLFRGWVSPLSVPEVIESLRRSDGRIGDRAAVGFRADSRVFLAVAVISGDDRHSRVRLIAGALLARRSGAPLVVVEDRAGQLEDLRQGVVTRGLTERTVSRSVDRSQVGTDVLDPALMTEIGLPPPAEDRDGVRPLSLGDLDAVVRVHRQAFPDSAVTLLGPRVIDCYYRWQFIGSHPSPFAAGTWSNGELVGFVFGGLRREAVTGYARRFLPVILLGAVTHPRGTRTLVGPKLSSVLGLMFRQQVRRRPSSTAASSRSETAGPSGGPSFGILSIAVSPTARGTGAADDLMSAAETSAIERGFELMNLTVNPDNHRAIRFYERLGWERVEGDDSWQGRMIKRIGGKRSLS